jgi:hypothetical protein
MLQKQFKTKSEKKKIKNKFQIIKSTTSDLSQVELHELNINDEFIVINRMANSKMRFITQ